jgi:hypothetical protein
MPAFASARLPSGRVSRHPRIGGGNGPADSIRAAIRAITGTARRRVSKTARVAFEIAWRDYLPSRTPSDFQAWRDQEAWTTEKYRRFDRGERMPHDWRARA